LVWSWGGSGSDENDVLAFSCFLLARLS
jgi:hypothetical protein